MSLTIGDVLIEAFPSLFDNALNEESNELEVEPINQNMEVLTHGVKLDLNTSVYWL